MTLASDLVYLVYIDDASLGTLYVVVGILKKVYYDRLNVVTYVAGFC